MPAPRKILYLSIGALLTRVVDLIGLFSAMYLSELLVENIIFGGAVYVSGGVWVIYVRLYNQNTMRHLPANVRGKGVVIFVLAVLLTTALLVFFPYIQQKSTCLVLAVLIGGFILQQIITDITAKKLAVSGKRRMVALGIVHAAFLAVYVVLFYLNHLVLGYDIPLGIGAVFLVTGLNTALLYVCQLKEKPHPIKAEPDGPPGLDADRLMDVHSYRIYNKMTVNTFFAFNISITSFICYMRFLPYTGFLYSALLLCLWLAFIALVTTVCFWLLQKRYLAQYDRPVIFLAGILFWAAAALGTVYELWGASIIATGINSALMGASLACMLSIILLQSYEMKTVIELGVGKIDNGAYERNTGVMLEWSTLTSFLLLLVMLTIASFIMEGKFDLLEAKLGMRHALQIIMLVLPMFSVLASLVFSLLQPLDRNYAEKLRKFNRERAEGKDNPLLENRLKKILVTNYPRRIAVQILKPLLRPFFPCKRYGTENVDLSHGPVVFVCNHLELYGPIMAVLHSPFYFRPWVINALLDKRIVAGYIGAGQTAMFLPKRLRAWLIDRVSPLLIWIMHSTDPIPVYRGTVREVIQTIQLSVEAMLYDDNILLFPEMNYQQEGVGDFFTGFVQVAKSYHKQTGCRATFYPVYVDKKNRRMTYGKGVTFDPENGSGAEKERIVGFLKESMNAMAKKE